MNRLQAARARLEAATPGPWTNERTYDGPTVMTEALMPAYKGLVDQSPRRRIITTVHSLQQREGGDWTQLDADAVFIAAGRTDLERALAVVSPSVDIHRYHALLAMRDLTDQEQKEMAAAIKAYGEALAWWEQEQEAPDGE